MSGIKRLAPVLSVRAEKTGPCAVCGSETRMAKTFSGKLFKGLTQNSVMLRLTNEAEQWMKEPLTHTRGCGKDLR